MPHIIVETNRGEDALADLVARLHGVALAHDSLSDGGIRTRGYRSAHSLVGDDIEGNGATGNGFAYVTVRLGHGRTQEVRNDIGNRLFEVLTDWAQADFDASAPMSLGLEVQEIAPGSTWKKNNIHDLLKARS